MYAADPSATKPAVSKPDLHGFTLIEVLVVLTVIAAIISIAVPVFIGVEGMKNETISKVNMRSLGIAMDGYYKRMRAFPKTDSGVQFLLAPMRTGLVDHSVKTIRNMYVAPGDDFAERSDDEFVEAYRDLDHIDPSAISYAGRNTKAHPLRRKHAASELIACEAGGADGTEVIHRHKINVLYLDCSVSDIDILRLPNGDSTTFAVGPESPLEALRTLNKNP